MGPEETIIHVSRECPAASEVWGEGDNPLRKWALLTQDFRSLWMEMVKKLSKKDRELCSIICKNLWLRRNSYAFEEKFESPKILMNRTITQLEEFQAAQLTATKCLTRQPTPCDVKKWQPPEAKI